jgi:hypothetical protein
MSCNKCNKDYPIANKKYGLCGSCNFQRTHNGETQQQVYSARALLKPQKIYTLKKSIKPIKQHSTKDAAIKKKLYQIKNSIELEAVQNDMYYCWGCGQCKSALDKSHILSVGKHKKLELEKENMNLFCRTCHDHWESGNIERMGMLLTFEKDLFYIKEQSLGTFSEIIFKINQYILLKPTGIAVKKFEIILK